MQCHCLEIQNRGLAAGCELVRPENPDPEDPGGAHDPMRNDAMDGEELMVPRVSHLPPEPSARQIAEHELLASYTAPAANACSRRKGIES